MKKQCILCSAKFEAKRADANYCSEKCRAKANYEIRKKKASGEFSPDNLPVSLPLNSPVEQSKNTKIEVIGTFNIDEIRQMVVNIDSTIANFCAENTAAKAQITLLSAQKSQFYSLIIDIEEVKIKKLEVIQELPDVDLYNNYLNGEYVEALKKNDTFADFKLITPDKLSLESSNHLRFKITQYRLKAKNTTIAHYSEVSKLKQRIQVIDSKIKAQNKTIEENNSSIRFNQSRIIRLEQLIKR